MRGGSCSSCNMRGGNKMQRGGDGGASWALQNFGGGDEQFNNTFGPGSNPSTGGILQPLRGAPAVVPYNSGNSSYGPTTSNPQLGGRRRKGMRRSKRTKKHYR